MASYGTFAVQFFRVWNVKAQSYVVGLHGRTRRQALAELEQWLSDEIGPHGTKEYRKARRNYRIAQVQVSLGDSPVNTNYTFKAGDLTAIVVQGRNWVRR